MDFQLEFLHNKVALNFVHASLNVWLDRIKSKSPEQKDIIQQFTECRKDVQEAQKFLLNLETEFIALNRRTFDLETINLQLHSELKELKRINKELLAKVNL